MITNEADAVNVTLIEHCEDGHWWIECPQARGFTATGETREQARTLALEGLSLWFQRPVYVVSRRVTT